VEELLEQCQIFKNLNAQEMQEALQTFHYQVKKYQKGDILVHAQEVVVQQLILLQGDVKSEMTSFDGKLIKIADLKSPRILAPGFLFGNHSHYPISLTASNSCEVMAINKENFLSALQKNAKLQLNFLNLISNQTQFLTRKLNFLNFKTIKGKIAHYLLNSQKRQQSNPITMDQSQTKLADLFGVTRPSLSRAWNDMNHSGIINSQGNQIQIIDLKALRAFLG